MIRRIFFFFLIAWTLDAFPQKLEKQIDQLRSSQLDNLDSTLLEINRVLPEITQNGSQKLICECLELKGNTLARLGSYDSAIILLQESILICEKSDNKIRLAEAHNGLGYIYDRMDNHEGALENFLQAAAISENIGDFNGVVRYYLNAVSIFGQQNQREKVKEYIRKAQSLMPDVDDPRRVSQVYYTASSHYSEIGQEEPAYRDSAIFYAKKGIKQAHGDSLYYRLPQYYAVLATTSWLKDDFNEAILYCDTLFAYQEHAGYRELIIGFLRYGDANVDLENFEEAEKWYDSAEFVIKEVESLFYELALDESRYKLYKNSGDFEKALRYYEKVKMLEDSLFSIEHDEKIAELEAKYESERKANEIALLQNEVSLEEAKSSRKNWIIGTLIFAAFSTIFSLWLIYQRRLSKANEQAAIHKQQLLRSQVNPHFIFNSLSSIRGFLFETTDTKPAITYLGKFAKLMRMVLELSSKEWVTLEEELKALELYLEIQQIRFNRAFGFEFSIDPSLNPSEVLVPPLTAQPFIENAIEHGLKGIERDGHIEISCLKKGGKLVFNIQDNGIGIDHVEPKQNHQSRAITIFRERISLIGSKMKTTFSFNISDLGKSPDTHGTLVTYELPLIKE